MPTARLVITNGRRALVDSFRAESALRAYNDNDQSPCEVANSLVGTCSSSSPFQALGANIPMYGGPSDDSNACLCNLVEYNLLRVSAITATSMT